MTKQEMQELKIMIESIVNPQFETMNDRLETMNHRLDAIEKDTKYIRASLDAAWSDIGRLFERITKHEEMYHKHPML